MNEEEKSEKADLILKQLQNLKADYDKGVIDIQTALKGLSDIKPPEKHEHEPPKKESAIEHIDTCPTCRNQFIEKLSPEIKAKTLKEIVDKAKGDYNCVGCGLKVERETETCPLCGKRPF